MKLRWALVLLALAMAVAPWPEQPPPPTARRAREVHRPALKRPLVQAPPRLHRHR